MNDRSDANLLSLVTAEARRALHRRAVWVLIAIALVGVVLLGVIAYFDSAGKTLGQLHANGTHPAVMRDWWVAGGGDGTLMIAAIPLLIGGLLGGATVAGAEWRAGTITTVLTWEPRRWRLHGARLGTAFVLAVVIAVALEALFLSAALPAVLLNGTTAGTDASWWLDLVAAGGRIALFTGIAAVLGASLATLGRGTTFALAAAFGWLSVGENLVRGLKPSLQHLLMGENLAIALTWAPLDAASFTRSQVMAVATVAAYACVLVAVGGLSFARRDIAGGS